MLIGKCKCRRRCVLIELTGYVGLLLLGRSQRSKPKSRCRDRKADFVMVQNRLTDMEAFLNRQIT
jgi:hypothetical protein